MNQPQQQNGAGSCMDDLKRWWTSVPFGSKLIYYFTLGVFFLNMFTGIARYLYNSPDLVLKFQIWRMFTTQFVDDILGILFGLLSLTFTAIALERSIGTITFICDFMFKNFLIQLLNFIIIVTLSLIFKTGTNAPSYGLFNIVILYMSLRCFSDPETQSNFMCFPIQIKNKFQPFAILLFFTLLSGQIRFDFISAVILGFIEVKFYGGMMLRLPEQRIASLKNSFIFKPMSNRSDFVDQGGSFLIQSSNNQNQDHQQAPPSNSNFSGRGVTIGGDPQQASQQSQSRPNQQQYVINPSQDQNQQLGNQFQQFAGKGVSIGGQAPTANTLSIQQQRELQLKRLQQQQESEFSENKLEVETNVDSSNDSNTAVNQKNQTKKDGYSVLNEDLL